MHRKYFTAKGIPWLLWPRPLCSVSFPITPTCVLPGHLPMSWPLEISWMLALFQVSASLYMLVPLHGPPFLAFFIREASISSSKTENVTFSRGLRLGLLQYWGQGWGRVHPLSGGHIRIPPRRWDWLTAPSLHRENCCKADLILLMGGCPVLWLLLEHVLLCGSYWKDCQQFPCGHPVCHCWVPALSRPGTRAAPESLPQWIREGMKYEQQVHLFPRENSWKNDFPSDLEDYSF